MINGLGEGGTVHSTIPTIIVSRNPTIVTTLVDSGAIKANYIDVMLFNRLKAEGSRVITLTKRKRVSSALAGEEAQEIKEAIEVLIVMMNEITSKEESLILTFNPIKFKESSPFQMIIGLPSIRAHRIASFTPSIFEGKRFDHNTFLYPILQMKKLEQNLEKREKYTGENEKKRKKINHTTPLFKSVQRERLSGEEEQFCLTREDIRQKEVTVARCDSPQDEDLQTGTKPMFGITSLGQTDELSPMEGLGRPDNAEDDDIVYNRYERATSEIEYTPADGVGTRPDLSKVRIEGPPSLQLKLRELCEKFQHIFSEEVSPIPA